MRFCVVHSDFGSTTGDPRQVVRSSNDLYFCLRILIEALELREDSESVQSLFPASHRRCIIDSVSELDEDDQAGDDGRDGP